MFVPPDVIGVNDTVAADAGAVGGDAARIASAAGAGAGETSADGLAAAGAGGTGADALAIAGADGTDVEAIAADPGSCVEVLAPVPINAENCAEIAFKACTEGTSGPHVSGSGSGETTLTGSGDLLDTSAASGRDADAAGETLSAAREEGVGPGRRVCASAEWGDALARGVVSLICACGRVSSAVSTAVSITTVVLVAMIVVLASIVVVSSCGTSSCSASCISSAISERGLSRTVGEAARGSGVASGTVDRISDV